MLVFISGKKRFTSLCHQLSFLSNLFAHFSGSQPGCALNGLVSFLEILASNPISPWWEVRSSKLCIFEKYPGA